MSQMRLSELRRLLLGLLGPNHDAAAYSAMAPEDWGTLNAIAAQHRLLPLLHARQERCDIKADIPLQTRDFWHLAHRESALIALAQRRAALDVGKRLDAAGIKAVALKGSWMAWNAYPSAAERPMRDIDLLIGESQALEAFALLKESGFRQDDLSPRDPLASLHHDKHLPPLTSPDGVSFELHMRLWERSEAVDWWMPESEHTEIFRRACRAQQDDPLCYPASEDMLAHLVVHGVYSNRLNGGPLFLTDLDWLTRNTVIDWPRFWARARAGGWHRGAALALHLTDTWCRAGLVKFSGCPVGMDCADLSGAPDLLLQDLGQRKTVGLVAGLANAAREGGLSGLSRKLLTRLSGKERGAFGADIDVGPGRRAEPGPSYGKWAATRACESVRALADADLRRIARQTSDLGAWLAHGDGPRA